MSLHHEGGSHPAAPVRILIVDDHELTREALRSILARESDLQLVGEASNGSQAVSLASQLRPDVVVMDIRMPDGDGLTATREIKATLDQVRVILLTSYSNPEYVFEGIRSGADGYLSKGATKQEVLAMIRQGVQGELAVQPSVAAVVLKRVAQRGASTAAGTPVSRREFDVLRMLAVGLSNKEIAVRLGIGRETVKTHVSRLLAKLEAADRTDLAVRATRLGLIHDEQGG